MIKMKMKIHFDPYGDEDAGDEDSKFPCGARVPEYTDHECSSTQWQRINCKQCIKQKEKLMQWMEETEKHINQQMQEQVDYDNETKVCV